MAIDPHCGICDRAFRNQGINIGVVKAHIVIITARRLCGLLQDPSFQLSHNDTAITVTQQCAVRTGNRRPSFGANSQNRQGVATSGHLLGDRTAGLHSETICRQYDGSASTGSMIEQLDGFGYPLFRLFARQRHNAGVECLHQIDQGVAVVGKGSDHMTATGISNNCRYAIISLTQNVGYLLLEASQPVGGHIGC